MEKGNLPYIYIPQISLYLKSISRLTNFKYRNERVTINSEDSEEFDKISNALELLDQTYDEVLILQNVGELENANEVLKCHQYYLEGLIELLEEDATKIEFKKNENIIPYTWKSIMKDREVFFTDTNVERTMIWIQYSNNWLIMGMKHVENRNYDKAKESFNNSRYCFEKCVEYVNLIDSSSLNIPDECSIEFCKNMSDFSRMLYYSCFFVTNDIITKKEFYRKTDYCQQIFYISTKFSKYVSEKWGNTQSISYIIRELSSTIFMSLVIMNVVDCYRITDDTDNVDNQKKAAIPYARCIQIVKFMESNEKKNSEIIDDLKRVYLNRLIVLVNTTIKSMRILMGAHQIQEADMSKNYILTKIPSIPVITEDFNEQKKRESKDFLKILPYEPYNIL